MKERIDTAGERGKRAFLLEKIRREISTSALQPIDKTCGETGEAKGEEKEEGEDDLHEEEIIARIIHNVEQTMATSEGGGETLRVLGHITTLTDQQAALVNTYNLSFHKVRTERHESILPRICPILPILPILPPTLLVSFFCL